MRFLTSHAATRTPPPEARTFERQVVELHISAALLNRFSQIGRPQTVPVAAVAWVRVGLGSCRLLFDLCNKADAGYPRGTQRPIVDQLS